MRIALIVLTLTLIFITVLTQKTSLRIKVDPTLNITVGFTLFSLELTSDPDSPKKKRQNKRHNLIKKSYPLIQGVKYLLKRTNITVNALYVVREPSNPLGYLAITPRLVAYSAILGYIKSNAETVTPKDVSIGLVPKNSNLMSPNIDILFSFNLFYLFISALIVAYYKTKSYLKKRKQ